MRIEVRERNKDFFDECLYVTCFFKKILKNPNRKIMGASKMYFRGLIVYLLAAMLFIFIAINEGFGGLYLIFIVIYFWFAAVMAYNLFVVKKQIKLYMNDDGKVSVFEINENVIRVESYVGTTVELNWDLVKYILINKETISFVPEKLSVSTVSMFVSTKYKEIVIDAIRKYNKESLIIDNSELYK